jgi:hypothetical protein
VSNFLQVPITYSVKLNYLNSDTAKCQVRDEAQASCGGDWQICDNGGIMISRGYSENFISFGSKYSHQHPVFKHPQSVFLT